MIGLRYAFRGLALWFALVALAGCGDDDALAAEGLRPGDCSDGADNDGDGDFDCRDTGCFGAPACLPTDGGPSDAGVDTSNGDAGADAGTDSGPGSDASGTDAVVTDAPGDAGELSPTVCTTTHAGAILCDSFEEDDTPARRLGRTFTLETGSPYRGDRFGRALLARTEEPHSQVVSFYSIAPPLSEGAYHVRFYMYHPVVEAGTRYGPIYIFGPDHTIALMTRPQSRTPGSSYFIDRHSDGLDIAMSGVVVPEERWVCVRIDVVPGNGTGQLTMRYDDTIVFEENAVTIPDGLRGLQLGAITGNAAYPDTTPLDIRFDELVVDTSPIPCD